MVLAVLGADVKVKNRCVGRSVCSHSRKRAPRAVSNLGELTAGCEPADHPVVVAPPLMRDWALELAELHTHSPDVE